MEDKLLPMIESALAKIPQGLFILTAQHEDRRTGTLVSWVQQVGFTPPMVSVALAKGRDIMPLISESRRFGLCQIPKNDKTLLRKFAPGIEANEDPFLGLELAIPTSPSPDHHLSIHVPILASSLSYLACEVVCHVDVEGDHDIFIGHVRHGQYFRGEPHIHLRTNGGKY